MHVLQCSEFGEKQAKLREFRRAAWIYRKTLPLKFGKRRGKMKKQEVKEGEYGRTTSGCCARRRGRVSGGWRWRWSACAPRARGCRSCGILPWRRRGGAERTWRSRARSAPFSSRASCRRSCWRMPRQRGSSPARCFARGRGGGFRGGSSGMSSSACAARRGSRRGDLVEEQNVSPLRDTSCKGDPLLLTAGKPIAALTRAISSGMMIDS